MIHKIISYETLQLRPEITESSGTHRSVSGKTDKKNEKIPLRTKEGYIFINPEDIIRCDANKKVSICILKCNIQQELLLSMKQTEAILKKYGFYRVHHAHLVNINHIEKYVKDKNSGGSILLSSGDTVTISKRKKSDFINYLKAI